MQVPQVDGYAPLSLNTYTNPLPIEIDGQVSKTPPPGADPFVLRYRGRYYCYPTGGDGVLALQSRDLVNWRLCGMAMTAADQYSYWAPSVIYHNGKFYMYYSSAEAGKIDDHSQYMKVAVADCPTGPFTYVKTFFENFSIDSHAVQDADGRLYLFYSPNNYASTHPTRPGTVIVVDELLDPFTLKGDPQPVILPTLDQEIFARNRFGDGRHWHTIEGALHFTRGNRQYVTYSGNAFTHEHYFVGYATAPKGPIGQAQWRKWPDESTWGPIMRKNARVEGTGHNSVTQAPNGVDDFLVYHGREFDPSAGEGERRLMRIDPIRYMGDALWVSGPSYTPQDAPARASFADDFEDDPCQWTFDQGDWTRGEGVLRQGQPVGVATAVIQPGGGAHFVSAYARWLHHHMGGRYGLAVVYADPDNQVTLTLDEGLRLAVVSATVGGIHRQLSAHPLPKDFDCAAWHLLRAQVLPGSLTAHVDGILVYEGAIPSLSGHAGLVTAYTKAEFSAFVYTDHFETFFDGKGDLGCFEVIEGGYDLTGEGLRPLEEGVNMLRYTQRLPEDVRIQASYRLDPTCGDGPVGLVLGKSDHGATIWMNAARNRCGVLNAVDGMDTQVTACDHAPIFGGRDITFEATRVDGNWRILVDHEEIYRGPLSVSSYAGLVSENVRATVTHFAVTEYKL